MNVRNPWGDSGNGFDIRKPGKCDEKRALARFHQQNSTDIESDINKVSPMSAPAVVCGFLPSVYRVHRT
jgi:hypothetical protein